MAITEASLTKTAHKEKVIKKSENQMMGAAQVLTLARLIARSTLRQAKKAKAKTKTIKQYFNICFAMLLL